MKTRYLLAAMVAALALAVSAPAFAKSVKGVVKSLDPQSDMFVVDPEEEGDSPLTFTIPEGKNFGDLMLDIEVGDDVLIEFDLGVCADDPDCDGVATEIEEL